MWKSLQGFTNKCAYLANKWPRGNKLYKYAKVSSIIDITLWNNIKTWLHMKGFKMIDKTEIYLYLHSEYALRINITKSERIEDRRKKVVVRK